MLKINELYTQKDLLLSYRPLTFQPFKEKPLIEMNNPVVFIADRDMLKRASYFNFIHTNELDYDIYTASYESTVLFYIIDIKIPKFKVVNNGIIMRRGQYRIAPERTPVRIKYALQHFRVLSNANELCTIFASDVTTDPKT